MDDDNCFSLTFSDQMHSSLDAILALLEANYFLVNPSKCEWAAQETDWLGNCLTPTGLKRWSKQVWALINMMIQPTSVKQTSLFVPWCVWTPIIATCFLLVLPMFSVHSWI